MKNSNIFEQAIRTSDVLVKMFGSNCEVAVHNFNNLEQSLIHLAGTITGRHIGAPITDLILQELKKKPSEIKDMVNYKTVSSKGIVMKSSTVFLRDTKGMVIGALCINFNISGLFQLAGELQNFIKFEEENESKENFYLSVQDVVEGMVNQTLQGFSKVPALLDMDEKIECVKRLEDKGAFLIKGSTEYVANVLGVSKFTIYNYLQKIRADTNLISHK